MSSISSPKLCLCGGPIFHEWAPTDLCCGLFVTESESENKSDCDNTCISNTNSPNLFSDLSPVMSPSNPEPKSPVISTSDADLTLNSDFSWESWGNDRLPPDLVKEIDEEDLEISVDGKCPHCPILKRKIADLEAKICILETQIPADKPPPGRLSAKEKLKWYQQKTKERNRSAVQKHRKKKKAEKENFKTTTSVEYQLELEKKLQEDKIQKRKEKTRERVRRFRKNKKGISQENNVPILNDSNFANRMQKCRAIKKVKDSITTFSPKKRSEILTSLLNCENPNSKATRSILEEKCLVNTTSDTVRSKISNAVLMDVERSMNIIKSDKTPPEAKSNAKKAACVFVGYSIEQNKLQSALSQNTGLDRRTVNKCLKKRKKIVNGEINKNESWKWTERKTRNDKITNDVKKKIYDYWLEHSYPVNDKRKVIRERIGRKVYLENPKHVISATQTDIYMKFIKENPEIAIGQRMFEKLKPFYIKSASRRDRITCLCIQHVEMQNLFNSVKKLRRKTLDKNPGLSEQFPMWTTVSDLVKETLCNPVDVNGESMFNMHCLERNCQDCGVENIKLSSREKCDEDDDLITWQRYEYVSTGKTDKNGKTVKKKKLVNVCTSDKELWTYVKKVLTTYPLHQFQATWQKQQLKNITENLPQNHVVMIHDYSEDFKCELQDEIQSDYFCKNEVAMHVTVLYRHAMLEHDGVDSTNSEPNIVKEYLFVLFDDKSHDRDTVHHARILIVNKYSKQTLNYDVEHIHEFTDGCSQQYKSRFCLRDLSFSGAIFGCITQRNFFETSHGKGEQDAAGSHVKNKAHMSVVRRECKIENAEDLFNFLNKTFQTPATSAFKSRKEDVKLNKRVFFHARDDDRERQRYNDDALPVKQNRQIHCVRSLPDEPGVLMVRKRSCYCMMYLDGHYEERIYSDVVGSWTKHVVSNVTFEQNSTSTFLSENDEFITECVTEENFDFASIVRNEDIIVTDSTDDSDFRILKVVSDGFYMLENEMVDGLGRQYSEGDFVLKTNPYTSTGPFSCELDRLCDVLVDARSVKMLIDPEDEQIISSNNDELLQISKNNS